MTKNWLEKNKVLIITIIIALVVIGLLSFNKSSQSANNPSQSYYECSDGSKANSAEECTARFVQGIKEEFNSDLPNDVCTQHGLRTFRVYHHTANETDVAHDMYYCSGENSDYYWIRQNTTIETIE